MGLKWPWSPWWIPVPGHGWYNPANSPNLTAVFETFSHDILLDCLLGLRPGATVLWWIQSCLKGRFLNMVLEELLHCPLASGVLQGSICPHAFQHFHEAAGRGI